MSGYIKRTIIHCANPLFKYWQYNKVLEALWCVEGNSKYCITDTASWSPSWKEKALRSNVNLLISHVENFYFICQCILHWYFESLFECVNWKSLYDTIILIKSGFYFPTKTALLDSVILIMSLRLLEYDLKESSTEI